LQIKWPSAPKDCEYIGALGHFIFKSPNLHWEWMGTASFRWAKAVMILQQKWQHLKEKGDQAGMPNFF
jgi:hypothetical protein